MHSSPATPTVASAAPYRGRLAPSPTGYLHLGHARTFWIAGQRAQAHGGVLVLRDEDLDPDRCRADFAAAAIEDLRWFGCDWQEGPDVGGPFGPYRQSERHGQYLAAWKMLRATGLIYPSPQSRRDIDRALLAPHDRPPNSGRWANPQEAADLPALEFQVGEPQGVEPIFPPSLRPEAWKAAAPPVDFTPELLAAEPGPTNWRFRVPDGETIAFDDGRYGRVERTAGADFGDFVIWRRDGHPSYELAVVADDHAMRISEVVRGADLLMSTARQLLLYRALCWQAPAFYHCPLLCDAQGRRLAKRTDAAALRSLRAAGKTPQDLRQQWDEAAPELK